MATVKLGVTTSITNDAAKGLDQAAKEAAKLANAEVKANKKLVDSGKKVAGAKDAQLSASKQVALAVKAEVAAGKPLQVQLVKLEREYTRLEADMRAVVKAGGRVSASQAKQAAGARNAIVQIKAQARATKAAAVAQRRATASSASFASALKNQIGPLIGVAAAVMAARKAYAFLVTDVIEAGDNIAKSAGRLGIGIEALQELRFAASLSGVAIASFDKGLAKLAKNAVEASRGVKTYKDAFDAVGVSATDTDGKLKTIEQLLPELANGFKNAESAEIALSSATLIFGRAGVDMITMLKQGKTGIEEMRKAARDAGGIIGTDLAQAAERAKDNMLKLHKATDDLGLVLSNTLVPIIADKVVPALTRLIGPSGIFNSFGDLAFVVFTKATGSAEDYKDAVRDVAGSWGVALSNMESKKARMAAILAEPFDLVPLVDPEPTKTPKTDKEKPAAKKAREERKKAREKEHIDEQVSVRKQLFALANLEANESKKAAGIRQQVESAKTVARSERDALRMEQERVNADARFEILKTEDIRIAALEKEQLARAIEKQREQINAFLTAVEVGSTVVKDLLAAEQEASKSFSEALEKANADFNKAVTEDNVSFQKADAIRNKAISSASKKRDAEVAQSREKLLANLILMGLKALAQFVAQKAAESVAESAAAATKVTASTAAGVAGAISAHSGIPFIGVGVGVAAAAAVVAAIVGAVAATGFADGGEVTGGTPGEDSVLALLEPKEIVLPVKLARQFRSVIGQKGGSAPIPTGLQKFAGGGAVRSSDAAAVTAQPSITVHATFQMLQIPNRAEWDRFVRDEVAPSLSRIAGRASGV